MVKELFSAEEN